MSRLAASPQPKSPLAAVYHRTGDCHATQFLLARDGRQGFERVRGDRRDGRSMAGVRSQSLSVLSQPPESAVWPSGENATELTSSVCPAKLRISFPVATSQSLRVLSLPDSAVRPSGENATAMMEPVCPAREPYRGRQNRNPGWNSKMARPPTIAAPAPTPCSSRRDGPPLISLTRLRAASAYLLPGQSRRKSSRAAAVPAALADAQASISCVSRSAASNAAAA